MWYWNTDNTDSLWYKSMKIFIQKEQGDWTSVVEKIYKDIKISYF